MRISILTLFPEMFTGPFEHSIIKRSQEAKKVTIELVNIRNFGLGKHKVVDDRSFGGGIGMVMRVDVLDKAIETTRKEEQRTKNRDGTKVVLLDARGKTFNQKMAKEFSELSHLILICGHYEGVDERVKDLVDKTVSIGDFVLTGGEIPAMTITDAVVRLIPGVLKKDATENESFSNSPHSNLDTGTLEYPQYTHPRDYKGVSVPEILLSGNHKEIAKWREEKAIEITKKHRPDLLVHS